MSYCYVLSENEASDISVALNCADCPQGLRILYRAIIGISREARLEDFDSRANLQNYNAQAHATLARLTAKVAGEYWRSKLAA